MKLTRGQRAIEWIEAYCRYPSGPQRGERVFLTPIQHNIVCSVYDSGDEAGPITGTLASYLVLLHICGPEHANSVPVIETDCFTVWASTSERLRDVLKREGEVIRCPELGTSYPPKAA